MTLLRYWWEGAPGEYAARLRDYPEQGFGEERVIRDGEVDLAQVTNASVIHTGWVHVGSWAGRVHEDVLRMDSVRVTHAACGLDLAGYLVDDVRSYMSTFGLVGVHAQVQPDVEIQRLLRRKSVPYRMRPGSILIDY